MKLTLKPLKCSSPHFSSSKLQLLEWVSSDAITSILHKLIEQRMEQHCRGEYERSFLLEFQEVRRKKKTLMGSGAAAVIVCELLLFCLDSGWNWCWAGSVKCLPARGQATDLDQDRDWGPDPL